MPGLSGMLTFGGRGRFVMVRALNGRFGCGCQRPRGFRGFGPTVPGSFDCGRVNGSGGTVIAGSCSGSILCASFVLSRVVGEMRRRSYVTTIDCVSSRTRGLCSSNARRLVRDDSGPDQGRMRMPFVM